MAGIEDAAQRRRQLLEREELTALYGALRVDVPGSLVWAPLAAAAMTGQLAGTPWPLDLVFAWAGCVVVTAFCSLATVRWLVRRAMPLRGALRHVVLSAVGLQVGATWSVLVWVGWSDDPVNRIAMLCVVLIVLAVLLLRYSNQPLVLRVALAALAPPVALRFLLAGDAMGLAVGLVAALYFIWTAHGAEMMIATQRGSRILRFEHEEMARDLGRALDVAEDERASAERANADRSAFLAQMSHELRTPLNAIIGFSDMLRSGLAGPLETMQAAHVRDIHGAGTHLLSLVAEILDLSRIEAGVSDLEPEDVVLDEAIESAIRLVTPRANSVSLLIRREPAQAGIVLRADRLRLKQILVNLLSNAVKFSHPEGTIRVETALAGDAVRVAIVDHGIGMDPADVPRALAPFRQIESAGRRLAEGTGLGLPLSVRLVAMHGGTLHVETARGLGTRVVFELPGARLLSSAPAAEDEAAAAEGPPAAEPPAAPAKTPAAAKTPTASAKTPVASAKTPVASDRAGPGPAARVALRAAS